MKNHSSKHLRVGIGGICCSCCFPARGTNERKLEYRAAKRRALREAMKIEEINRDE